MTCTPPASMDRSQMLQEQTLADGHGRPLHRAICPATSHRKPDRVEEIPCHSIRWFDLHAKHFGACKLREPPFIDRAAAAKFARPGWDSSLTERRTPVEGDTRRGDRTDDHRYPHRRQEITE